MEPLIRSDVFLLLSKQELKGPLDKYRPLRAYTVSVAASALPTTPASGFASVGGAVALPKAVLP